LKLPPFIILEPGTKKSALTALDKYRNRSKIIAGGTEVVVMLKLGLLSPSYLISLRNIRCLNGIRKTKNEVIIGSTTTINEIIQSRLMNKYFKGIIKAAKSLAAPPIQNRATIGGNVLQNTRCIYFNQSELFRNGLKPCFKAGGNICHAIKGGKNCFSVYQSDMAPALISFNSKVKLEKKGSCRVILLSDIFTGKGENPFLIEDNELLTEFIIPLPDGKCSSSYEKLRIRSGLEYPLVSVAVSILRNKDKRLDDLRIIIGAAGSAPKIIENVSSYLKGGYPSIEDIGKIVSLAEDLTEFVNNLSIPGAYRRKLLKVLIKRAIQIAFQDVERGS